MADLYGALAGQAADANIAHTQATTRLDIANAKAVETKAAQDQMMMELARQSVANIGTDTDPVEKIQSISNRMLDAGFAVQGTALAQKANQIRLQRQQTLTSASRTRLDEIQAQIKEAESVADFLGQATDPESFQQAKMVFMQTHPGQKIPPQLENYNPQIIDMLHRSTAKGLQDLRDRENQLHHVTTEINQEAALKERKEGREFRARVEERNIRLREELRSRREKVAGKDPIVGTPSRDMIQAAQSMIQELHPGIPSDMPLGKDNLVSSAAFDVASLGKSLMTKNRGLSASEAMQQAMVQLEKEGRFSEEPGKEGFKIGPLEFGGTKPKSTYSRRGGAGSGGQILPLPPRGTPLVKGAKYRTPKGVVQWDGQKAVLVSSGGTPSSPSTPPDDDEGVRTP